MTFSLFVSRDSEGRPRNFEKSYEKDAIQQIARSLRQRCQDSPDHYAVLANLVAPNPCADLLIISNTGIGVADLKAYNNQIIGTPSTE